MIKVSIIGATGYTGAELVRLLTMHPHVELAHLTSHSYVGEKLQDLFPNLYGFVDHTLVEMDLDKIVSDSDVIFAGLPHGHSVKIGEAVINAGKIFIDLGADFRLDDAVEYTRWYQGVHDDLDLLDSAVYGLPELNREAIKKTKLIANPGCFPTSILLGLAPLMADSNFNDNHIIIDSKSGTTGAGRSGKVANLFSEVTGNFKAYSIGSHRHTPEIEQELSKLADKEMTVSFVPHLLPVDRGILSTIYVKANSDFNLKTLYEKYHTFYDHEPFVTVLPEGVQPEIKNVRGTNNCQIGLTLDQRSNTLIIVSVIDNLMKGASGQAVQNMNILMGLEETTGLLYPGLRP
ncbi:N-acetyl-gamma-glutamyl-phosphate reductase [Aerococcaceae bacterium DSM 111022]|nr:N-acetyl-gamma-glutamyl-phosphate reductase [Aerococcaceae bacterium DSM 111022]